MFTDAGTDGIPEEKQEIALQIRAAKARADFLSDYLDWARQEQQDQDMLGLSIWCTGLGGGDPPEQGFLHVLSCVPHSPVYGATLARKDDWEKNLTTLGRTAAVHEYFVFAALSSSHGAQTWERVPGAACCDAGLLAHRAAWVLANAKLIPAHRREPHPSWTAAVSTVPSLTTSTTIGFALGVDATRKIYKTRFCAAQDSGIQCRVSYRPGVT